MVTNCEGIAGILSMIDMLLGLYVQYRDEGSLKDAFIHNHGLATNNNDERAQAFDLFILACRLGPIQENNQSLIVGLILRCNPHRDHQL